MTISAELATRDTAIELARVSTLHPISLPDWEICALIHHSSYAVLYLVTNEYNEKAVIKRLGLCTEHLPTKQIQAFTSSMNRVCTVNAEGMVGIFQAGLVDNSLYLLMEYLEGGTLADKLKHYQQYSLQQRFAWFEDIILSLINMHDLDLAHYDLKPSNIMFRADDELVLVDCGLENQWLIQAGYQQADDVYCSPLYVSPECAMGEEYNEQAEIYSLGIIFYELLTGEKPYRASSVVDLIKMHALAPIPLLPAELQCYQPLLNTMLAKYPEERYVLLECLLNDVYQAALSL